MDEKSDIESPAVIITPEPVWTKPESCRKRTKHGSTKACIFIVKPNLKGYREGDCWACPRCGTVWRKVNNQEHHFGIPDKDKPNRVTYPKYVWEHRGGNVWED